MVARALAAVALLALGCAPDEQAAKPEREGGLYLSVVTAKPGASWATQLTVFDLSDAAAPRAKVVLEAEESGSVSHVPHARSPSGRYGLYQFMRRLDEDDPWDPTQLELHLLDFQRDPLGPTRRLLIPSLWAAAGWTEDESLMYIVAKFGSVLSLWTLALDDDGRRHALARIPIDVPPPAVLLDELRFSPGGTWLYFVVGSQNEGIPPNRLFAVRFEQRQPVELIEVRASFEETTVFELPFWVDDDGRGLTAARVSGQSDVLLSFDLSRDSQAWEVPIPGEPVDSLAHYGAQLEGESEPSWVVRGFADPSAFEGVALDWIPLDWSESSVVVGAPIRTDAEVLSWGGDPRGLMSGEHHYFIGRKAGDPPSYGVMHLRAGEAEAQVIWPVPDPNVSGLGFDQLELNDDRTLLAVHGYMGVVVFELGAEGPGPAQLASPTNLGVWGLYGSRFVQALDADVGKVVRVADYGASPPTVWDLPAIAPLAALPSPIDARLFMLDDGQLWVEDLDTRVRERLTLPAELEAPTETGEAGETGETGELVDPADLPVEPRGAAVHAPGITSYAIE